MTNRRVLGISALVWCGWLAMPALAKGGKGEKAKIEAGAAAAAVKKKAKKGKKEKGKPAGPAVEAAVASPPEPLPEWAKPLSFGMAAGFVSASSGTEDWRAGGAAEISALYRWDFGIPGYSTAFSLRFAPYDVAMYDKKKGSDYVGTVERYLVGGQVSMPVIDGKFVPYGIVEFGLAFIDLQGISSLDVKDEVNETLGFVAQVGLGADWLALDRVTLGPRLMVGFGTLSTIEFGAATTLSF